MHGLPGSGDSRHPNGRGMPDGLADPDRVLIWDLDGTIADTRADIATGVLEMLRELGRPPLDPAQVIRNVGRGVAVLVAGCLTEAGMPARDAAELERGVELFRAHYWRHLMDTTVPYAGMPELLQSLKARGRAMAIVSNKPQDATREILRRMGLLDCFVGALGGDSLAVRKPDPAPLWHALELCLTASPGGFRSNANESLSEIAHDRAAMIGDSLPDVLAARAAGMPVCGVAWGFDPDGDMRRVQLDWWFESVEDLGRALLGPGHHPLFGPQPE
jgi:phosphoglycolate phosphatase